ENETIPPQVPAWEDFVDIYLEPAQVFARRAAGRFGPALIVLTIMSAILAAGTQMALSDALTADIQRAMANSSAGDAQMSPEALEQMQRFGMLGAVVGSLVFVPVGVLVSGFVIWLLGMAVDAALTFGAAAMIATFAAF